MRTHVKNQANFSAAVALGVLLCVQPIQASDGSWTGAQNTLWTNGANWSVSPYAGTAAGETATFIGSGNGNTVLDLTGLASILNLTFGTADAAAYTVGSGGAGNQTLVLENGSLMAFLSDLAAPQTFNAVLQLGTNVAAASYLITNLSPATVTFAGGIKGAPAGGTAGTKTVYLGGDALVSGVIENGGASALSIYFTRGAAETDVVTLTASNTFTGNINVRGGILVLKNSAALGSGSKTVTIANNADGARPSIWLDGTDGDLDIPATVSWTTSNAKEGALVNVAGNNTVRGNISLYSGDGDTWLISRGGKLTLTGNLSATATSRALHLRGDANGEISGAISNGSTPFMPVYKSDGVGAWTLSGSNTYSGVTTIGPGSLILSGDKGSINASTGITVNAGATLLLNNTALSNHVNRLRDATPLKMSDASLVFTNDSGAANFSETAGALILVSGNTKVITAQAAETRTATLTFGGLTRSGTATVNFIGLGLGASDRNRIFISGLANGPIGPWATVNGGFPALYSSTLGVYADSQTAIAAKGDTIQHNSANVVIATEGTTGPDELSDTVTSIGSLVQNTAFASTVNTAGKTLQADSVAINEGKADLTLGVAPNEGVVAARSAGGTLALGNNGNDTLTVNAVIADNAAPSSLLKLGTGDVVLAGTNTFFGTVTIAQGELSLADSLALQYAVLATGGLVFDSAVASHAFTLGNLTNTVSQVLEDNADNPVALTVGNSNAESAFGGGLSGGGSLIKTGHAALTITGANTHTGGTSVSAGTLNASQASALGTGPVVNDALLNLKVFNTTYAGLSTSLSGTGTVNVTLGMGSTNTVLSGDYSGFTGVWNLGVTGAGGKAQMNGADNAAATVNVLTNATLLVNAPSTHNATAFLYGGTTGESYGQLRLEGFAEWAGPVKLVGNCLDPSKGFFGCNSGTGIVSGVISDIGGQHPVNKVGGSTVVLSATNNTYEGQTWVRQGTLVVSALKNVGEASSLGQPANAADGTIRLGNSTSAARLGYIGTGDTTARVLDMAGTTGGVYLDQAGSGLLKFTSDLTYSGTGSKLLTLQGSTEGVGELACVYANGSGATNSLTKTGKGAWRLSNVNTFSGETDIQDGILSLANPNALVNSSMLRFSTTLNGVLALDNDGVGEPQKNLTVAAGFSGTVASGAGLDGVGVTHGFNDWALSRATVTVCRADSVLSGAPAVYVRTVNLSGGNSGYITGLNPTDADLIVGSAAILSGNYTKSLSLGGTSSGNVVTGMIYNGINTMSLYKDGPGIWTLLGSNTYSGATTVNNGMLVLAGSDGAIVSNGLITVQSDAVLCLSNSPSANNPNRLRDTSSVSINGGTLDFVHAGGSANYGETLGAVTVASAGTIIRTAQASESQSSVLTLGALARTAGSTVNFSGPGLGASDRNRVFITSQSPGLIGPWATVNDSALAMYNSTLGVYAGSFTTTEIAARGPASTIPDDASAKARITTAGTSGPIVLAGATVNSIGQLQQATDTPAEVDMTGKTLRAYGIAIEAGQESLKLGTAAGQGTLTALAAGGNLNLVNDSTNTLTVNAAITDNAAPSALTTSGTGNILLNGQCSYSGPTALTEGSLTFGSALAQTLSGVVSGDGTLIKSGTNSLYLTAANTYTGPTYINEGIVRVDQNTAFGTAAGGVFIADGATLDVGCTPDVGGTRGINLLNLGTEVFTVRGAGVYGKGAIVNNSTGSQYSVFGKVTMADDTTFGGSQSSGRFDLRNNTPTLDMNGYTLTKVGPNLFGLVNAIVNPGAGNIDVREGSFRFEQNVRMNGSAANTLTIRSGAAFELYAHYPQSAAVWSLLFEDNAIFRAAQGTATSNNWAGPVTLQGSLLMTGSGSYHHTFSGDISGSGSIVKYSSSTANITGTNNTYSGLTAITNGVLSIASIRNVGAGASSLGAPATAETGRIRMGYGATGATLIYTGTGDTTDRILDLNGTTGGVTLNQSGTGPLTFTSDMATSGSGNKTLTLTGSTSGSGAISGAIINSTGGKTAVSKTGSGTWTLSGNNAFTGDVSIAAGTLVLSGTNAQGQGAITVGTTTGNAVMKILPGTQLTGGLGAGIRLCNSGGSRAALYMTGGTVTRSPKTGDDLAFTVGKNAGSYGYFNMSGGEMNITRIQTGLSGTTSSGSNTVGNVRMTGGMLALPDYILIARSIGSQCAFTVDGGTIYHTNALNNLSIGYEGGRGELNLTGGTIENYGKPLTVRQSLNNSTGIVNLCAGSLSVDSFQNTSPGIALLNFAGGTLKVGNADSAVFIPTSMTGVYSYGPFGAYAGGAVIDAMNRTNTVTAPIRAPTGNGVYAITLTDKGSGYIGEPYVAITGPDGLGATAVANMEDDGLGSNTFRVASITITSPGVDYVTTPTIFFRGGGNGSVAPTVGTVTLSANASGGLTKLGAGMLILSNANTYAGSTIISNGTVKLGNAKALPTGTKVVLAGGSLDLGGYTVTNTITSLGGTVANGTLYTDISPAGTNVVGTETLSVNGVNVQGKYLADVTAGGASDHVTLQGNVNLSGLSLELVNPGLLDSDRVYVIAQINGTRTGTFTPLNLPESRWHVIYAADGTVKLMFVSGTVMFLR